MFVEISEPMNALKVELFLRPYKKGEVSFTPSVATKVLQMTNNPRNIKDMLELVAGLPAEQQQMYRGVILSTFERREQPESIILLGKQLAKEHHFESELNNKLLDVRFKVCCSLYYHSGANVHQNSDDDTSPLTPRAFYISPSCEPNFSEFPKGSAIIFTANEVDLSYGDMAYISKACFADDAEIRGFELKNIHNGVDFSNCSVVNLTECDLKQLSSLELKEGACIVWDEVKNIPQNLDISKCSEIRFVKCDLNMFRSMKFKDNAIVSLEDCYNLPEEIDFSNCCLVALDGNTYAGVKKLIFKNRQQINPKLISPKEGITDFITFLEKDEPFNLSFGGYTR